MRSPLLRLFAGKDDDSTDETAELAQVILQRFPADQYPHLAEFTTGHVLRPGYDFGDEFEFGLDLILDGLEKAQVAGRPGKSRPA